MDRHHVSRETFQRFVPCLATPDRTLCRSPGGHLHLSPTHAIRHSSEASDVSRETFLHVASCPASSDRPPHRNPGAHFSQNSTGEHGRHRISAEPQTAMQLRWLRTPLKVELPCLVPPPLSHPPAAPHRVRLRCVGDVEAPCPTVNSAGPKSRACYHRRTLLELPAWSVAAFSHRT